MVRRVEYVGHGVETYDLRNELQLPRWDAGTACRAHRQQRARQRRRMLLTSPTVSVMVVVMVVVQGRAITKVY